MFNIKRAIQININQVQQSLSNSSSSIMIWNTSTPSSPFNFYISASCLMALDNLNPYFLSFPNILFLLLKGSPVCISSIFSWFLITRLYTQLLATYFSIDPLLLCEVLLFVSKFYSFFINSCFVYYPSFSLLKTLKLIYLADFDAFFSSFYWSKNEGESITN